MSEFSGKIITKPRQDLLEMIKDMKAQSQAAVEAQKKLGDSIAALAIATAKLISLQESASQRHAHFAVEKAIEKRVDGNENKSDISDENKSDIGEEEDKKETTNEENSAQDEKEQKLKLKERLEFEASMTGDEKSDQKSDRKSQAQDLEKKGENEDAINQYNQALEICPLCYSEDWSILMANKAAALIKMSFARRGTGTDNWHPVVDWGKRPRV